MIQNNRNVFKCAINDCMDVKEVHFQMFMRLYARILLLKKDDFVSTFYYAIAFRLDELKE